MVVFPHEPTPVVAAGSHRDNDGDLKDVENSKRTTEFLYPAQNKCETLMLMSPNVVKIEKRILFLKNKAGELLKTKGNGKKQTENKPETKLSKLLKTEEGPKKQTENKPKNKAGHVVENKRSPENRPGKMGSQCLPYRIIFLNTSDPSSRPTPFGGPWLPSHHQGDSIYN